MENNIKELNLNEMEEISGGFKIEMLNAEELDLYNKYLEQAKSGSAQSKKGLLDFKTAMRQKYGNKIFDAKDFMGILKS